MERLFSRVNFAVFATLCLAITRIQGEILTPPYFNLAEGRKITATATCGEDTEGPELYCKLVGTKSENDVDVSVIQGQFCDVCDPTKPDKRHPPEYAVDGMETWWQSPPLSRGMKYNKVNLTIDLGQEFHVAYVYIRMGNSPRPGLWVLEKSADYGKTYTPWQYFSDSQMDCETHFGSESLQPITKDDSVICSTEYSNILPLEGGEIPISLLLNRPSSNNYFNSTVLQEWTRATNVRLRFLRTKNFLGHLMSVARQDPTVTRRYFYSIKDISIGGRCMCNGHADTCDNLDPSDPSVLLCRCQHNTCGAKCNTCCPGYVQKAWRQSKYNKPFICEPCNCFQHSTECLYDPEVDKKHLSLDIHGNYDGGGVCQNCQHNTAGINCKECLPKFYRPYEKNWNDTDVCQPCDCENFYSTGNCSEGDGKCECRKEFQPPNCDSCSYGHFGYPNCKPCECFLNGTIGLQCESQNGRCTCRQNFGGKYCKECAPGYYNFPECRRCECNSEGSLSENCDQTSGNCTCKNNFSGKQCEICQNGSFGFPACNYCNCDLKGTNEEICDKSSGKCICKEGYTGERCDMCKPGYYGYPDCQPCMCGVIGSLGKTCSVSGKCSCLINYAGQTCEQCSPGFYNYPNCTACDCDSTGSNGVSCDNEGRCECHYNFDGEKCDKCKEGFYNFPACEDCNCHPAGVIQGFAGCGSVPAGELCQCKERVQGRICNKCKPFYWNLNLNNPYGCEECNCNPSGTLGGLADCQSETGQCFCKSSVVGRSCSDCDDGSYSLNAGNLFGCQDCGCDVGGSLNSICDKLSGQCLCQSRVTGRTCTEPLPTHYFPTLYQYQYEVEDGHSPANTTARYAHNENVFPSYSWKGYGVFSHLQKEILQDIYISKSSLYLMILKFVNQNPETIVGTIRIIPESYSEVEQKHKVQFKSSHEPAFVTVSDSSGNTPTPFVINPGKWTVSINIPKEMFVDYFVLLPEDYYLASILKQNVGKPCKINESGVCRDYSYPNITQFDTIGASFGQAVINKNEQEINEYYENQDHLQSLSINNKVPLINSLQTGLSITVPVSKPGKYVLVISYISPLNSDGTTTLNATVNGGRLDDFNGHAILYNCKYTFICRQIIMNNDNGIGIYFAEKELKVILMGLDANAAIHSVTAIPLSDLTLDYITPQSKCILKDGRCVLQSYRTPQESKKLYFDQGGENEVLKNVLHQFNFTSFVILDNSNKFIDLKGKVPSSGYYTFIIHYYQPYHSEFKANILIQNGQFYEASVPFKHCPSPSGCRSVITENTGNQKFNIIENFMITVKDPGNKNVFLFYILIVPSDFYTEENLKEEEFDQSSEFIKTCGANHFNIDTSVQGFCQESVFSITAAHNGGARPCQCNYDGSLSFECDKFGGQCRCKPNVIGRKCEACKPGYFGFPNCKPCNCPITAYCEPIEGKCVCPPRVIGERCDQCAPLTYGYDPISGCEECNCDPLGIERTYQCDLFNGSCSCKPNVIGRTCNMCVPGHFSFPHCQSCECDIKGTTEDICDQNTAECFCKKNVVGPACERCQEGTFNLQENNELGCTECFCFGKTTRCDSSKLVMVPLVEMSNWELVEVNLTEKLKKIPYNVTLQTGEGDVGVDFTLLNVANKSMYFSAPLEYLGKRLHSYGGFLNYTMFYTINQQGSAVSGADVILEGNNTYLSYFSIELPPHAQEYKWQVPLVESSFDLPMGISAKREHIMEVLRDLKGLYIRAKYWTDSVTTRLTMVSLDEAISQQFYYDNPRNMMLANSIEDCQCPPNYQGLSCEDCAPGYYRIAVGPHGGYCIPCQCNGHSNECDVNTGVCLNCTHHTTGDHCDQCEVGYHGNAKAGTPNDCLICACPLPITSNNFATGCDLSSDGEKISCQCREGYIGAKCEACAPGFYGRPDVLGDYCKPCQCHGNINPSDPNSCDTVSGECLRCLNNTFGTACSLCAPGFYGDAIKLKDCQACICDEVGTSHCNSYTGECVCKPNVIGEKCDRCAYEHYGFPSGKGCTPCRCAEASESNQCDDITGQCKCKPGVTGRSCDRCAAGHWNYTSDGCLSCGCKSDYSVGFGCNALTGQCECLAGVMGEKCDQCPYRWAFVPEYGCHECDRCTHALLDTTDDLSKLLDPVIIEFDSTHSGYFTLKRLNNMKEMLAELKPRFDEVDPKHISLNASLEELIKLETMTRNLNRGANYSLENSDVLLNDTMKLKEKYEKILNELLDSEESCEKVIDKINSIVQQLNEGDGPAVETAVKEGEELLNAIKIYDLTEREQNSVTLLNKAIDLFDNVSNFKEPVDLLDKKANNIEEQLKNFTLKLDDLYNNTQYSIKKASEAENILNKSGIKSLKKKLQDIENQTLTSQKNLNESEKLNKNSSDLLKLSHVKMKLLNVAPELLGDAIKDLNVTLESNEQGIQNGRDLLHRVESHADKTKRSLEQIENILADTTNKTGDALKAANAYRDILNVVQEARTAAEEADKEAVEVVDSLNGIGDSTYNADQNSSLILNRAFDLHSSTMDNLDPALENAKNLFKPIQSTHTQNQKKLDDVNKRLSMLELKSLDETYKNATEDADIAMMHIQEVHSGSNENFSELKKHKEDAKLLPKELDQTMRNIIQIQMQLSSINEKLPKVLKDINSLPKSQEDLQAITGGIQEKINYLKDKVLMARDLANRVDIGVKFYPNTTLELRNPPNIEDLTTSTTMSGYFKTDKQDGLLFYLGNPVGTNLRRTKSDDYMALIVQNGYPVLKLDLGNGNEQVINDKYVSDNQWYQYIIERTGNNAKLIIREELPNGVVKDNVKEEILEGPLSIFNLDKNKSKLFIGGLPSNYNIQGAIDVNSFDGEIQDMYIGDTAISLWNFNNGYENNHGSQRRDKLLNKQSSSGLRFNGNGYVLFNARSYNLRHRSDIQLKFKTFASEGLLFLAEKDNTFISLELRNGQILYQYNLGHKTKLWHTSKRYNDGQWHTISASREGPRGQMTVDSENVPDRTDPIEGNRINSVEVISFGGYPGKHNIPDVTNIKFDGCIDKTLIMGNSLDFNQNIKAYDVALGCPEKVAKLVSFVKNSPGYIRHTPLSVSNNFKMNLKFKTKESDGLIFYATNQDQSDGISLSLNEGKLVLISQKTEHISKDLYNDSDWHVISIMHTNQELRIDFDDYDNIVSDSPPIPLHILYGSLYIGGLPMSLTAKSGMVYSSEPFFGCIADVTLNGVVINFANTTDKVNEIFGKCMFDSSFGGDNPDVHKVPTLPPLDNLDRETTISPIVVTEDTAKKTTILRGDGGWDGGQPEEVNTEILTIGPPITEEPIQTIEPEPPISISRGPIGTVPPPTTLKPKAPGCALPLYPGRDEEGNVEADSYRFGTQVDSRIEFSQARGRFKTEVDFDLEFKTSEKEGILFYVSDQNTQDTYLALFLQDGYLVMAFASQRQQAAVIKTQEIYNDNEWHRVQFSRKGGNGKLIVDSISENTGVAVDAARMDLKLPFYLAGINPNYYNNAYSNLNTTTSFKGCIRNFLMNGHSMRGVKEYGVIPCSENVEYGTFFYGTKRSYVILRDKIVVGETFNVKLDIKPRLDSGILLTAHGRKDYFLLEMVNGSMRLTAENGMGPITAVFEPKTPYYFCDGQWHNIQAVKSKNVVTLSVDNVFTAPKLGDHRAVVTSTGSALFLGGHRHLGAVKKLRGVLSNQAYVGCIKNLYLNDEYIQISPQMARGNVTVGSCRTN